jgi:hypothetical protein
MMRRTRSVLAGVALIAALLVGSATPAHAAGKNGACEYRELCLYYLINLSESFIDFELGDNDHRNDRFTCCSGRLGWGQIVADNAQSGWNRNAGLHAIVASLLACEGSVHVIRPNTWTNLNSAVKDKNWSNCWSW